MLYLHDMETVFDFIENFDKICIIFAIWIKVIATSHVTGLGSKEN